VCVVSLKTKLGTLYITLNDVDIVFINKPHSIHKYSLITLYVKIIPITSVLSINLLCCSHFRGDFYGDYLHGYIPQSIDTGLELSKLIALDSQLINGQSGRNMLSLSHIV
jgi:DNA-directed RNA polymerase-4 subunit 1